MITDRMVRSLENDVNGFLREIDISLEASRNIFRQFEQTAKPVPESSWQEIQQRVGLTTLPEASISYDTFIYKLMGKDVIGHSQLTLTAISSSFVYFPILNKSYCNWYIFAWLVSALPTEAESTCLSS